MKLRKFPITPKSTKGLEIGDFWSIPIENGVFACGRVIGKWPEGYKGYMKGFLGGLLDWHSDVPPTFESIAGSQTIIQGGVHINTILKTGCSILGNRSIELDGIIEELFIEYPDNKTAYIYQGLKPIRVATKKEVKEVSVLSIFGYLYLRERAIHEFSKKST